MKNKVLKRIVAFLITVLILFVNSPLYAISIEVNKSDDVTINNTSKASAITNDVLNNENDFIKKQNKFTQPY